MSLKDLLQRQVQFFHPEKKYGFLRGGFNRAAHAALFGLREQFFASMQDAFTDKVKTAAATLCDDPIFCQAIRQWPLKPAGKVVVLGDSLTDDSQSWFAILAQAFATIRPNDDIEWINLAVSGDTTAQLLGSVVPAAQLEADLYLCFSGINDARIQGGKRYKVCVSIDEAQRNLASVVDFASQQTKTPWVFITPVGVDVKRIEQHDFFKPLNATWCPQHVQQVADLVVKQTEHSIDLRPVFGDVADSPLMDDDGLHWSIDGQQLAAKTIAEQLPLQLAGHKAK